QICLGSAASKTQSRRHRPVIRIFASSVERAGSLLSELAKSAQGQTSLLRCSRQEAISMANKLVFTMIAVASLGLAGSFNGCTCNGEAQLGQDEPKAPEPPPP